MKQSADGTVGFQGVGPLLSSSCRNEPCVVTPTQPRYKEISLMLLRLRAPFVFLSLLAALPAGAQVGAPGAGAAAPGAAATTPGAVTTTPGAVTTTPGAVTTTPFGVTPAPSITGT